MQYNLLVVSEDTIIWNVLIMFQHVLRATLVAICQSQSDTEVETAEDGAQLGIVDDHVQDFGGGSFTSAPGVETLCVFPKNPSKCRYYLAATAVLFGFALFLYRIEIVYCRMRDLLISFFNPCSCRCRGTN